jgi:hypothetical protein
MAIELDPTGCCSPQRALARRSERLKEKGNILSGATVYLSGPMDFVASREEEKKNGWRNRVGQFLKRFKVTVYDPWNKPEVAGMPHYGKEDEFSTERRKDWTFDGTKEGDRTRAELCSEFWPTMHIDLRMTDTAAFLIAYVPTNIYSVGTVHEIVMARLQHKPVLFVSPPVAFPAYDDLVRHLHLQKDDQGLELLRQLVDQAPLHPNSGGTPSMWYMALVDAHYFFDGFGFEDYRNRAEFKWAWGELDEREKNCKPRRPLLKYLEQLNQEIPKRYDLDRNDYVENPDWLIFDKSSL